MSLRPQSMVFTLFGDYVRHRGGDAWVGTIIRVGSVFGLSEQAVRSALSRMARRGWLSVRRVRNRSYYGLTERSVKILAEGDRRIFEYPSDEWDGTWWVLTYSIPERTRELRDRLRKELTWLGYGLLGSATWISPRDHADIIERIVDELGVRGMVELFRGTHHGFSSTRELVNRCWDLESINRRYAEFINEYRPRLEALRQRLQRGDMVSEEEAFRERFLIVHLYRKFPFIDPQLPDALLPEGWLGKEAMAVFRQYRELLAEQANRFFDRIYEGSHSLVRA
jgi:phenylacetic acid degradation operon negative regulatory protein